jgi:hypothetical protein
MRQRFERAFAVTAVLLGISAGAVGQTQGEPEEFSAFAINMGALTGGTGATAQLVMTVNRWSTQAERDALFTTLKEKGAEAMLEQLRHAKRVGSLRTPSTVGYDIRLALMEPGKDGGRRVLLLTDRPVGFSEATNRPPSIDYPFTVIDMQIPPKGFGQGTLSIAAKIIPAGKTVIIENYDTQPVQLNRIEPRKLTRK